jgi:hypothetical protein
LNDIQQNCFSTTSVTNFDFSGLTSLNSIGNSAFATNTNLAQVKFFDNSGCTLGSNVYPDLSGEFSTGATPSIEWINTGFTIPTDGEYTWNV